MKPYQEQSYYELLEVQPGAPLREIRAAYERAVEMYAADSVALYALEDPDQAEELRRRLRHAMDILGDDDLRDEYDRRMGFPVRSRPLEEPPAPEEALAAAELLASSEALRSTHPEVKVAYATPAPLPPAPPAPPPPQASPPEPVAREPVERAPVAPRVSRVSMREVDAAPGIGEQEAIATAEAAMASVAARVHEGTRPRSPLELPENVELSGELLRRIRESRGITIQQIADRTRISSRHLENIEADRYAALPVTVYLRGILTHLARELGLDPARVVKGYLQLVAAGQGHHRDVKVDGPGTRS